MSDEIESAVLAAEQRRCAAMLANDGAALAALLDARLSFTHSTGVVDGKDAYLAKMAAGRIVYVAIDWSDAAVTVLAPNAALLTGRMINDVEVEGVAKRLNNQVITVWGRDDAAWRLIAFQSTPLAG